LKSFIDCGYAVDLYTYDVNLVVPAGVRVCDAAELASRDEVFVYQSEGLGKGSPSAFSNYFRYKLLAEKGGWWIDTDVVCLTDRIPVVDEFFARQDNDFIACGTMYFAPCHPVMQQCLEQAVKLGHTVKWGDSGPRLLTRVLTDYGALNRVVPASVYYPVHYSEALDALRPSKTAFWRRASKRHCSFMSGIPCSFIAASRKAVFPREARCCVVGWTDIQSTDGPGNTTNKPWRAH
jgi:Glycosyltransferase sugar-binding region containing DXD motif